MFETLLANMMKDITELMRVSGEPSFTGHISTVTILYHSYKVLILKKRNLHAEALVDADNYI